MAVVATIIFAVAVAAFARIPLLPDIGGDLSLTAGEIGLLTTAFGLGRLLTDLPAGRLADAVVPTVGLTGAGLLLALSCAVLASAEGFAVALGASALIGCASALTNTTGMYVFATAADAHRRGASMAIYVTALMSGQMVGPALGGAIGSVAGWRPAIAVSAAIGAGVAAVCGQSSGGGPTPAHARRHARLTPTRRARRRRPGRRAASCSRSRSRRSPRSSAWPASRRP